MTQPDKPKGRPLAKDGPPKNTTADSTWPVAGGDGNPFTGHAHAYLDKGWLPMPLWSWEKGVGDGMRARGKSSPPKGYTGRSGVNATREQIDAWISEGRYFNLATRMPDTVIVIDVDGYRGGLPELADLEGKHGVLPDTWTATARNDGSKHRYYRVDGRRVWANPGEGIDIIHWGWRYTVLPPSVHPGTGTPYNWFTPSGQLSGLGMDFPSPDDLTELPVAWVELLDTGDDASKIAPKLDMRHREVAQALNIWLSDGEPCHHMRTVLDRLTEVTNGGRHDGCMRAQMALVRYSESGHPGGEAAVRELEEWFSSVMDDRDGSSEWRRGLVNAVQRIAADPSENVYGCLPKIETFMQEFTTSPRRFTS
jgi:hypothetical protein